LAPIFENQTKNRQAPGQKAAPVLTEAEKRALEVRRAFLTSGVPEELKRQMTSVVVPDADASSSVIWPVDSHTQQRPTTSINQLPGCCDPWTLPSCDFHYRDLFTGTDTPVPLKLGSFTSMLDEAVSHSLKVCMISWSHCFHVLL